MVNGENFSYLFCDQNRKSFTLEAVWDCFQNFLFTAPFSLFLNYWYSPTSIKIVSLNWLYFSNSRTAPVRRCAFGLFLIWRIVPKFLPCIVTRRAPEIRNRQSATWELTITARPWRVNNWRLLTSSIAAKKPRIHSGRVVLGNSNNCAVRKNVFIFLGFLKW